MGRINGEERAARFAMVLAGPERLRGDLRRAEGEGIEPSQLLVFLATGSSETESVSETVTSSFSLEMEATGSGRT